jgi:hypothetical protein
LITEKRAFMPNDSSWISKPLANAMEKCPCPFGKPA